MALRGISAWTIYNTYNFIVELNHFIKEYNSDEQKQKSLQVYRNLSDTYLQNLFDFKALADNIEAQIIGNTENFSSPE